LFEHCFCVTAWLLGCVDYLLTKSPALSLRRKLYFSFTPMAAATGSRQASLDQHAQDRVFDPAGGKVIRLKVLTQGASLSGKSCLVKRFCEGKVCHSCQQLESVARLQTKNSL
jgi:hypothetical protein